MRYINAFFLTSIIYISLASGLFYFISFKQYIKPKDELKKISLNLIEIIKPIEKETKPKEIVKKKTKPIIKKVAKKVIKKIESKVQKIVKHEPKKTVKKVEPEIKKEIIKNTQVAKKSETKKITPNLKNYEKDFLSKNLLLIKKEIQKHVAYSKRAKKLNIQGDVLVEFCLTKEGKIVNLKTIKGHMLLRKSTLKAINSASLYFPKVQKNITIRVPIEYRLI